MTWRLAVCLIACSLGAATASAAPAPTALRQWVAFQGGEIDPGVHVLVHATGSCSGRSLADPRPDAWRCSAQGETQDPCFSGSPRFLLCPYGTPDSRDALELRLTRPLPARSASPSGPHLGAPWVIELRGRYCYRATGTPLVLRGRPASYVCAGASSLAGLPDRSRAAWTIGFLASPAARGYVTAAVSAAWW